MINKISAQKVSRELISQHFSHFMVDSIIEKLLPINRLKNYRYQDLRFELWHNCIWTNYGFISYWRYGEMLKWISMAKAEQLSVEQLGDNLFLVEGRQKSKYAVMVTDKNIECECMLYTQRKRRAGELPQLFRDWLEKPFCHHTEAVKKYLG